MNIVITLVLLCIGLVCMGQFLNWIDYKFIKNKYLKSEKFDLNICCGNTICEGVNADIVKRNVPRFILIKNIYNLPFKNKQFKKTICSHTLEHVDDPMKFFKELQRISEHVVILVPPLWDYGCMFNLNEHRWQFLTLKSKHINKLPVFFKLPLAETYQKKFGQSVKA